MRFIRTLSILPVVLMTVGFLSCSVRGAELRNFEDAALRAVQFWDNREGWAVGDEGVIWHTIDGGKHWERQPSGVRASLRSLQFLDPFTGWVVGREELPNGAGSAGVVLHTKDGGLTWKRIMLNMLPGLNRVRFVNAKSGYKIGYLIGDGSDAQPSGVFVTTDGGRSWRPLPGKRSSSWLAADFDANGEGALAGSWNRLATVRKERVYQVRMDALGGRALRDLQLRGDDGFAVGQGGLLLRSKRTRGSSWDYVKTRGVPEKVRRAWDFHALHGVGSHYWIVGRPGSAALHSTDRGQTWEIVHTGQTLPLNGIYFTDEKHGWAVGEFGVITATTDGGKTWKMQHRGGQRAAVLLLHARGVGVPLGVVAQLGGQEGYLCAAVRIAAPDLATAKPSRSMAAARFADAVRRAGGGAGEMLWAFPLSSHLLRAPHSELLRAWNALHEDQAAEQLMRQLILTVRMWRPAVVIADASPFNPPPERGGTKGGADGFPCDSLLAEAVKAAFERAGDAKTFPEQIEVLGLEPWRPAKVYSLASSTGGLRSPHAVKLDLTAIAPRLQATPHEFASGAAALLARHSVSLPDQRAFHLMAAQTKDAAAHRTLMQGVDLAPGGLARRPLDGPTKLSEDLRKAIQQRSTLKTLSETPTKVLTDPNRLLAQIAPMLEKMPDDMAGKAAFAVAGQYARMGQWALARETYQLLIDRYPTHPLAMEAYRWLIRHNSSSEARHRHELGQFIVVKDVHGKGGDKPGIKLPVWQPGAKKVPNVTEVMSKLGKAGEKDADKPGIKLPPWKPGMDKAPKIPEIKSEGEGQVYLFAKKKQVRQWYQSSLDLEPRLAAFGPLLTDDPSLQFCLQAARRSLGDFHTPHKWYTKFVSRQPDGPWRSAALAELWLANRSGPPPKPVLSCRFAETRPLLDGKLDDGCWQVPPIRLRNADGQNHDKDPFLKDFATEARLSHDANFLYISLKCAHPSGRRAVPVKPRVRDADLRGRDRVSVLLDLDRDYCTCFHLQVDKRGCVREECWGDKNWDPHWFVAVRSESAYWVVEAAIPLTALTSDRITHGKAWACNVLRVVPGGGVQAWSLPAEVPEVTLRPEGMGLLLFSHRQNDEHLSSAR